MFNALESIDKSESDDAFEAHVIHGDPVNLLKILIRPLTNLWIL